METKTLISCAVIAQMICAFIFAYADCWFSDATGQVLDHQKLVTLYNTGNGLLEACLGTINVARLIDCPDMTLAV